MEIAGRAKRLLLSPSSEWSVIEGETATMGDIYRGYVLPLVALSAAATAIGSLFLGLGIVFAIRSFLFSVIFGLAGVYLLAVIIDALAPAFGGRKNFGQAFKVAAYAPTAGWLAGVFNIVPPLAVLSILGLYSLYLFHVGLPKLMQTPEANAIFYTLAVISVCIIVGLIFALIVLPALIGGA